MRCAGAVLAGGASRRMGRTKAFIEIDGLPMAVAASQALEGGGARPTVIVGGAQDRFEALGLEWVADEFPGEGPLGGVITAIRHHRAVADGIVILPCDLLYPSPDAVRALAEALDASVVAVPVVDGRPQWVHAAWRVDALPVLEAAFGDGVRAIRHAIDPIDVAMVSGGHPDWYVDADSPDDLPSETR